MTGRPLRGRQSDRRVPRQPQPLDSYRGQLVRIRRLHGELAPADGPVGSAVAFPAEHVAYVVGAWNPDGRSTPPSDDYLAFKRLLGDTRSAGWTHRRAGLRDPANRGVEAGICVFDIREAAVLDFADRYGQLAVLRWTRDERAVLTADGTVVHRTGWVWQQLPFRPCPMRFGDPAEARDRLQCCYGDRPRTFERIHASADWHDDRNMLIQVLGCDLCAPHGPVRGVTSEMGCGSFGGTSGASSTRDVGGGISSCVLSEWVSRRCGCACAGSPPARGRAVTRSPAWRGGP